MSKYQKVDSSLNFVDREKQVLAFWKENKIFEQTNANGNDYATLNTWGTLNAGIKVNEPTPLFARVDKEEMMKTVAERQAKAAAAEKANNEKVGIVGLPQIAIDDFAKVELRVAEVKACEPIPRAKKLLKLTLDDGAGERTVASGIAQWYTPEDLIGHKVIVVANLKPATLCGVESQGMIIAADTADGGAKVLFVDDFETGAKFR